MARLARVVAPGLPHHVTQRGNRRQKTFFGNGDYRAYIGLMAEWCARCGVEIWAYCLMPNHVHLIAVPTDENALGAAIGEAHRRYTRRVNLREDWRGHLWQGRFASFPMDEGHLLAAARYIELNPVRAKLAGNAKSYAWSSARAHLAAKDDDLVKVSPLLEIAPDWAGLLSAGPAGEDWNQIRKHQHTGRPLGGEEFVDKLESALGRPLKKRKPGPRLPGRDDN